MKLYTEEQVKDMLNGLIGKKYVSDFLHRYYTPIELPTEEEMAIFFHEKYEELALSFGYTTRDDTRNFDKDSKNGKLMIEVCKEVKNWITTKQKNMAQQNDKQKQLLTEIMNADAKHGLYRQQTAVEWLHNQLIKTWYDAETSKELLEKAKQMEKEQIVDAFYEGMQANTFDQNKGRALMYYNETYIK